ncbi:MAG: MlaD family protein [Rhodocyclaceae bacterium]|jgi:phospholipid/cholesterol/gamma-HCH transport system substrate-binding protein|nr:MlaD family protein [Rhodocyclaceae bacterium]
MENRAHALLAGLFTLCFALAAALAIWWFTGTRELSDTYVLTTRGSVTGLNLEAQVRYRGIRAGKVRDIRPDPDDPGQLLVEISLARKYRLTDRTIARLNTQGVTGLAYVMLEEDGTGRGVPLPTDAAAPPRLPLQPGLLATLGERAGDIAGQATDLVARINRLLDERNLQNAATALERMAAASESLKELPALVAALRNALSADNLAHLKNALARLDATTEAAAPLAQDTRELIRSLALLAQKLDRAGDRLNTATLPQAEALAGDIAAATQRLDRLLQALDAAPQSLLFGRPTVAPGPGEAGHVTSLAPGSSR